MSDAAVLSAGARWLGAEGGAAPQSESSESGPKIVSIFSSPLVDSFDADTDALDASLFFLTPEAAAAAADEGVAAPLFLASVALTEAEEVVGVVGGAVGFDAAGASWALERRLETGAGDAAGAS